VQRPATPRGRLVHDPWRASDVGDLGRRQCNGDRRHAPRSADHRQHHVLLHRRAWFAEWENSGTYYDKPENHEKFNPANFVNNWKTSTLVVHGGLDYRIPDSQGIATFTALQRRGIERKSLYFLDENHWVLQPANSVL
jgi:dipeptidyl aminopeptidase/acylaminoacyl peptidase